MNQIQQQLLININQYQEMVLQNTKQNHQHMLTCMEKQTEIMNQNQQHMHDKTLDALTAIVRAVDRKMWQ